MGGDDGAPPLVACRGSPFLPVCFGGAPSLPPACASRGGRSPSRGVKPRRARSKARWARRAVRADGAAGAHRGGASQRGLDTGTRPERPEVCLLGTTAQLSARWHGTTPSDLGRQPESHPVRRASCSMLTWHRVPDQDHPSTRRTSTPGGDRRFAARSRSDPLRAFAGKCEAHRCTRARFSPPSRVSGAKAPATTASIPASSTGAHGACLREVVCAEACDVHGACPCNAPPTPASTPKPQRAGHSRSRHPAWAAYARAE